MRRQITPWAASSHRQERAEVVAHDLPLVFRLHPVEVSDVVGGFYESVVMGVVGAGRDPLDRLELEERLDVLVPVRGDEDAAVESLHGVLGGLREVDAGPDEVLGPVALGLELLQPRHQVGDPARLVLDGHEAQVGVAK